MMHEWWQRGTIYHIYPRSFHDANGDGIGDLRGIAGRLDYLRWLGVDAIWLSPIYPSPMADFGYDVTNYTDIDPLFGTLDDFRHLLAAAHERGLKVILDFVPNHTSIDHPWFVDSRSSRTSRRRDWYIWRDPRSDGSPPNNWRSVFGGSAWQFDEQTGQYYYHAYLKEQPDLNWRNAAVRDAMFDVLRFWLDLGVDGFRVDVIWQLLKDADFRDNPANPAYRPRQPAFREHLSTFTADLPEVHDVIDGMRRVINEYRDRVLIGEIYLPVERLMIYYGASGSGLHLPFNFQLLELPWHAQTIGDAISRYEALLPAHGWPNWVLGNHDKPRIASRVGAAQARVAALLLLTLRGTPTVYYGDEIGMSNVAIPHDRVMDPWERNEPGLGAGRDPCRTPLQWRETRHAGFTSGEPWLPVSADYRRVNIAAQRRDCRSMLSLYRRLLALRRATPALNIGGYVGLPPVADVLAYVRTAGASRYLIALNFAEEPATYDVASLGSGHIVLSTHLDREHEPASTLSLRPAEGTIVKLT
jgi:alpha-glucosidase